MRPSTPDVPDEASLAAHVDDCAARVDGRLGVLLGRPAGPTLEGFDVVVARGADRPYTSASVVKLFVLYALYRRHDGGLDALDEGRPIAPDNRVGGSGLFRLLDATDPSLRDLARAMIVVSDNAATNELLDHVGMDAVADVAGELGLEATGLGRKTMASLDGDGGLDGTDDLGGVDDSDGQCSLEEQRGGDDEWTGASPVNTTSPRDCARLFAELLRGDRLSVAARTEQLDVLRHVTDRSQFQRYLPYGVDLAHKPGWLPGAALDTGLVEGFGDPPLFFAVFCDRCANGGDATDIVAEVGDAVHAWLVDA